MGAYSFSRQPVHCGTDFRLAKKPSPPGLNDQMFDGQIAPALPSESTKTGLSATSKKFFGCSQTTRFGDHSQKNSCIVPALSEHG
jgi:hypothetical protein